MRVYIQNTKISTLSKLSYLTSLTEEGGYAGSVVEVFVPVAENYPKVIEAFKRNIRISAVAVDQVL